MFYLRIICKNITINGKKSLIVYVINVLVAIFLFLYINSIRINENQVAHLPDAIKVSARISNLTGSQSVGMLINESVIKALDDSDMVEDLLYTVRLAANFAPETPEEERSLKNISILGLNTLKAIPSIYESSLSLPMSDTQEVLNSNKPYIIVQDSFLSSHNLEIGDIIDLSMYSFVHNESHETVSYSKAGNESMKIVGSFIVTDMQSGEDILPDIICSASWVRETMHKYNAKLYADSANFYISDPFNLNSFKADMSNLGLLPVNPKADSQSVSGIALSINDEVFIRTAEGLLRNLTIMRLFLPFMFIFIAFISYIVSYLLISYRQSEIAILRSLGVSQAACEFLYTIEIAVIALFGCVTGAIINTFLSDSVRIGVGAIVIATFFVSFICGAYFTVRTLSRFSVLRVLTKT
ncbi:MAG: hypothetical protein LBD23_02460 [Oscillospiraceae bacterium]|jgi:ABC-type antimicrobial peptide transport system permease subunit|nr:hypothetical protein [Oscillospiraceae bacterium]